MDVSAALDTVSNNDSDQDALTDSTHPAQALSSLPTSNGTSRPSDDENKFQSAISAWRGINLTKLVPELDSTASDIVTNQRDALISRKDLAQKTKDFRKLDDASKLTEYKGLLKAYQTFIDLLTSHGKTTSSAFLQLYSSVSEAPDPYPLLEASVDALLTSEETLPKITSENEHLQRNVAALTSQLEDAERRLEEERVARKEIEASRDSRIQEVETSWKAVVGEKQDNWEAKERSFEEKAESHERLLNELKASYEVNQRLGQNAENEGESRQASASAAELEIMSSDLDRTNQRLAEVEARNEQLRIELAETTSNTHRRLAIEEDPAVTRLRSENSSLLRRLDGIKLERDSDARRHDIRLRTLERDMQSLQSDRESLQERMHAQRDYTDIKRELEIFKSIEFATLDDDENDIRSYEREATENGVPKGDQESLEQMLLAKNKRLSNEMAILRVSHQDLQQQLDTLQETLSNTNAELERAQNLNVTLESDLANVQQAGPDTLPSSGISMAGTYTSRYPSSSFVGRRGRASPTSSIISGIDPTSTSRTMEAIRAGEPVGGGSGIMPMIQAQRDRFKQKNAELEKELSKQNSTVSSLRQEIASLQKDNLSLYEKSRYVSTYSRNQPVSSSSQYVSSPPGASIQVDANTSSGLSVDRYRSAYEANLSPFAAFRGRESARAYRKMSLPERVIFSITRMVLANRTSRNLFAGYCLALHVLIFVMLYWMQTMDIEKHASKLGEAASAAVVGMGGDASGGGHGDWQPEGFHADST